MGPRRSARRRPARGLGRRSEWADAAHRNEPRLRTHDRVGHRVDEVDYDPAYQELTRAAVEHGFAGAPWADDRPGAHVARAAGFLTWSQLEAGHGCPISMTYAVLPALRAAPELLATYGPGLDEPDPRPRPARAVDQAGPARRHGHDREAGRLGRAGEHDPGRRHLGRDLPPDRPQVVHQRADVRPVPGAGAGRRGERSDGTRRRSRADLLPRAPRAARRHAQHVPHPAPQGQARQPVERVERARVRGHRRLAGRRRGPGRAHDHRDGRLHAAGQRARLGGGHAGGGVARGAPRPVPVGVRADAARAAADARGARRPGPRVRGRGDAGAAAGRGAGPGAA